MKDSEKLQPEKVSHLDQWIGYRCGLIASRLGAFVAPIYIQRHHLTTPTWRALAVVARFGPLSASTLAEHSSSDASKVSRAIDALVQSKLLTRKKDPADKRRALLKLTARGQTIYNDIDRIVSRIENRLIEVLSVQEKAAFMLALGKIDQQIAEHLVAGSWQDFVE